jgi:hypothetical protein
MSDLAIVVKNQQSSARGSWTEPRGLQARECVLTLANPERPEDGWKLVSSDHPERRPHLPRFRRVPGASEVSMTASVNVRFASPDDGGALERL